MVTPLMAGIGAVALLAVVYAGAGVADTVLGQPRNGGTFGRNRTTVIEDAIRVIGLAIIAAVFIAVGLAMTGNL